MDGGFDHEGFVRAVERRRLAEGLSWRGLARRLNLSPSTFSRLSRGRRPDLDTFVTVLAWLDMPADAFIRPRARPGQGEPDALAAVGAALRQDPRLHPDDAEFLREIVRVAYARFRTNT